MELHDDGVSKIIHAFVRNNPHIQVYEYIQRGFNGDVYFGTRKKMGDDVVLKFYWSHPNYDATEEAVILKGIKHDNILTIYDLQFLPPNFAYFLTPKISGGDLQMFIDNNNLSTKSALEIVAGILSGLTELHCKHKLVHRDLKPANILLDLDNNLPIIADLGAVKKIDVANGHVTASKSTYLYLPPESIQDDKYFFQSDIYQVGIILFQMLGGYFPINDQLKWLSKAELKIFNSIRNASERFLKFDEFISQKIVKGTLANTNTLPYYLDPLFKRILNKALNIDYTKRYKDASQFLKDVHILLRKCPEYINTPNYLEVKNVKGKKFKIHKITNGDFVLEKMIANNQWRKDNNHDGKIESILSLVRLN